MTNLNNQRLETLYQEAKHDAQLQSLRQQDRAALIHAIAQMLEIVKHWTIGITPVQPKAQRRTT